MASSSPGKPKRFYLIRSPSCENYERFNNYDGQDEMQKNIELKKGSRETFPERFNNSDGEVQKHKGAFNIQPKKSTSGIFGKRINNSGGERQHPAFNIEPKKTPLCAFPQRFKNSGGEGEKQKDAFNSKSKKASTVDFP